MLPQSYLQCCFRSPIFRNECKEKFQSIRLLSKKKSLSKLGLNIFSTQKNDIRKQNAEQFLNRKRGL